MPKRLLLTVAVLLAVGGFFLAHRSNLEAGKQAKAIMAADLATQDVKAPLKSLSDYVAGHMGSGATITLTGGYERAQAAAKTAAQVQNANSQIYAQAQAACGAITNSVAAAKCNQDYLAKHLVNVPPPVPVPQPKLADYQHKFNAPFWTPDLAGFLFLGSAATLGALLYSLRNWRP